MPKCSHDLGGLHSLHRHVGCRAIAKIIWPPQPCARLREPCRSLADPDAVFFDDPKLLGYPFRGEFGNEPRDHFQNPRFILSGEAKYDNSSSGRRRIGLDVGEVQVEGHECAPLVLAYLVDGWVRLATQQLVEDANGIMPMRAKKLRNLLWEILVDLESHAALRPGRSTIRSRASSAA